MKEKMWQVKANLWNWILDQLLATGCDEIEWTFRLFQFEHTYFGDELG